MDVGRCMSNWSLETRCKEYTRHLCLGQWRIQLYQNVSWVPDSMKFSNIYRVAKVERCVDCLVKKVELQICPMNFSRDGRYMLSRTRQLLLQQVWNTSSEN